LQGLKLSIGLTAFGCIEATRVIDGKTETDVRIFALVVAQVHS
jgi:hypothetical protein